MPLASLRLAIVAAALLVATGSPALAQEAAEPAAVEGASSFRTAIAPVTVHSGYQTSSHEALQGWNTTLVLGFRLGRPDASVVSFFEAGVGRLDSDDSPLVTSNAFVGARVAWRLNRFALHFLARVHHGDPMTGDDEVTIYSHSSSLGLMATFDILRGKTGHSMALGAHGIGQFHAAADGDDSATAFAGGGGLSFIVW